MCHNLPSYRPFFAATQSGRKRHEIRKENPDKPFAVGDWLILHEQIMETKTFTGRQTIVEITWISPTEGPGKEAGFAYLSIKPVKSFWQSVFGK